MFRFGKLFLPDVKELLKRGELHQIKALLSNLHPVDIEEIVEELRPPEALVVLRLLRPEQASEVVSLLEGEKLREILKGLSASQIAELVENMDPDDRTALFEELPSDVVKKILEELPPDDREIALKLLGYPEGSCGRIMSPEFITLHESSTAQEAIDFIREKEDLPDEVILSVYLHDDSLKLSGYVKLTDIVKAKPSISLRDISEKPVYVLTHDPAEKAARIMTDYDLLSLPVVDFLGRVVGVITIDDVVDLIIEEAEEDIHRLMAMEPAEEYFSLGTLTKVRKRLLWIVLLLVMENAAAQILHAYEEVLQGFTVLATFIPLLMATGGNVGSQSATLMIRSMAMGELKPYLRLMLDELPAVLIMAFCVGLVGFGNAVVRGLHAIPSLAVGVSLGLVVVLSNYLGMILPILARLLRLDPAVVSAPLIATLSDAISIAVYFATINHLAGELLG